MRLEYALEDAQIFLNGERSSMNVTSVSQSKKNLEWQLSYPFELGPHGQMPKPIPVLAGVVRLFQIVGPKMIAHNMRRPVPRESLILDPASDVFILPERDARHSN